MSCTCDNCGKKYKVDCLVDNSLWKRLNPNLKDKSSGRLCGRCIIDRLENLDEYNYYFLVKEDCLNKKGKKTYIKNDKY